MPALHHLSTSPRSKACPELILYLFIYFYEKQSPDLANTNPLVTTEHSATSVSRVSVPHLPLNLTINLIE